MGRGVRRRASTATRRHPSTGPAWYADVIDITHAPSRRLVMEFRKKPKAEGGSSSFVRNEWVTPPIPKHPQEWRPPGKEHRFEGRVPGESISPYSIYGRQVYGLQCGNENIQLNTYAYVVRPDVPDLSEVLDSTRVQEAMAELAANPNDRAAELAVNRVLAT